MSAQFIVADVFDGLATLEDGSVDRADVLRGSGTRKEPTMSDLTTCDDHNDPESGYLDWHAWAEKHSKTHRQVKCDECGLFKIWVNTEGADGE